MTVAAVTAPEFDKAAEVFENEAPEGLRFLRAPSGEQELASFVREHGAKHAIVGIDTYSGPLYEALDKGAVLARFGVGHDGIDKETATARGILATNTPGVLDQSVAEHTIALMLAAARHVPRLHTQTLAGEWRPVIGSELNGKRLALLGCGGIGKRVARIAHSGFGMLVTACKATLDGADALAECGVRKCTTDFAEAVKSAGFVSLHIPATPETQDFVNAERLAAIPDSAWLINTARGAVVDEKALFDALAGGTLAGAAVDVTAKEPYEPAARDKDLRTLGNVIMTPHVGSSTREACAAMARRAMQNVLGAEQAEYGALDLLNPAVLSSL